MALVADFSVVEDLGFPAMIGLTFCDYSLGCDVFVDTFLEAATDMVPVDTGALQGSIDSWTDGEEIECVAGEEYAPYVEYGTYKMEAQPYFEPALLEAYEAALPYWQDAVDDAQEEEEARQSKNASNGLGDAIGHAAEFGIWESTGFSFMGQIGGAIIGGIISGFINVFFSMLTGDNSSSGGGYRGMSHGQMMEAGGGTLENMNVHID